MTDTSAVPGPPGGRWTLGIDTSTDICVGLAREGVVVASDRIDDRRGHAEKLMPLVASICQRAGITVAEVTEVAVGLGPGPFTGLRVGIVTAHTIASLAGTPMHGVCSLDVVAWEWAHADEQHPDFGMSAPQGEFLVASDARRKELYWARYGADGIRLGDPQVSVPEELPDLPLAGPGCTAFPEMFCHGGPEKLDAGLLAGIWSQLPDAGSDALYLRKPDAAVPTTRKSTLVGNRLTLTRVRP